MRVAAKCDPSILPSTKKEHIGVTGFQILFALQYQLGEHGS